MKTPSFWSAHSTSPLPFFLAPLAWLYKTLSHHRITQPPRYRAKAKVICIGNATMGGAGKTPTTAALAHACLERGLKPIILSRGYGGTLSGPVFVTDDHSAADVGDEPLLLHQIAPVCIAHDRVKGAQFCDEQGCDVILMDDGFQNPALHKDLTLLVIDGGFGHGNQKPFPAGPLRESTNHALERADAVILIGEDTTTLAPQIQKHNRPLFHAIIRPEHAFLGPQPLLAFAGLARPEKFFQTLRATGHTLLHTQSFADHHPFRPADLDALAQKAAQLNAQLVTTEKDAMRLPSAFREKVSIYKITLAWQNKESVDAFLADFFQDTPQ